MYGHGFVSRCGIDLKCSFDDVWMGIWCASGFGVYSFAAHPHARWISCLQLELQHKSLPNWILMFQIFTEGSSSKNTVDSCIQIANFSPDVDKAFFDSRPEWGRIYLSLWLPMSCDMYEQLCGWETLKNFSLASVCCTLLKARCSGWYRRDHGKPAWLTLVSQRIIYTSTKNPGLWFVTDTNSNWTWGCQGLFSIWWLIFFHPTWSDRLTTVLDVDIVDLSFGEREPLFLHCMQYINNMQRVRLCFCIHREHVTFNLLPWPIFTCVSVRGKWLLIWFSMVPM